ncbi:MAG: S-methyl-5-thioribose-1-phosphate isomerase [Bacteroidota bacterium]
MNISNKQYTTIWLNEDNQSVSVIDQRILPFKFEILSLKSTEDVFNAISDMTVRGAPLIGVTGAFGVWLSALELVKANNYNLDNLKKEAEYIKSSRPTAINLAYAVDRIMAKMLDSSDTVSIALEEAEIFRLEEIENCRLIGLHGVSIIEEISKKKQGETVNILTHCNAGWLACIDYGTATAPIYEAFNKGIKVHVWVDETRPRNQGARLTAFELGEHGVPHTIIADNTGGHLMQHGMVDMVIVGSDRTTANGDVANKIGTYLKALAAKDNNIPFYVALPLSTIDMTMNNGIAEIPIETRSEDEVRFMEGVVNGEVTKVRITPENSNALNYGFDVTPARLVTGLITERGISKADKLEIAKLF